MNLTHALKWSFLSELAAKAISPIVFIILARLLTPSDYGVMSAALMVMAFSQIFWEAGMGKALIKRQTEIEEAANVAFWINIGLGIFIAILLFISADLIERTFFHDERVKAVVQVMTLQVLLGAVSSVHTAMLEKEMGFKKLFWIRLVTISLPAVASIPLALNGMGYWALVVGTLVGQTAQGIFLWRLSKWRPKFTFNLMVAKEMGHFGAWVGTTGFMVWFYSWVDALIIGMYLGVHELGLFRIGNQFTTMIFGLLLGYLAPVLYSHFVRMNQDKERVRDASIKILKTLTFISVPIGIIIFQLADPIGNAVFGPQWQGVGLVIGLMALVHGFAWVVGMNGEIYRAMNKPHYETIMAGSTMLVYIIAYIYSIRYGLEIFLWTRLALSILGLLIHLAFIKKLLDMDILPIVRYIGLISLISFASVALIEKTITQNLSGAWLQMIVGGSLSCIVIVSSLFVLERKGIIKNLLLFVKKPNV
jgi:O-antigen/teichoic acid export membrane protein